MKKLLLWLFGFGIIGLFGQVFAIETYINNKPVYLNVTDLAKTINLQKKPEIKDWGWKPYLYLNLNINDVYKFYEKTMPSSAYTSKLQTAIDMRVVWKMYEDDILISKQKENNNKLYLDKKGIVDYSTSLWKIAIPLSSIIFRFKNWENYIHVCISSNLTSNDFWQWIIPFKYAFCSMPIREYYYNWEIFSDRNKYLKYKNEINNEQVNKINSKLDFIKKQLNYYKLNWWFEKVEIYIKNYINRHYKTTLSDLEKQKILFNLTNILYKKYWFYNWRIIVPNILSKDDIYFVTAYYYKQYANQINNQYQQKLNQKEQYKQQALSNYWTLQNKYNQLKQEYEQYKLKTAENRQKAIKLTIILTKILSEYHNKETKLKLLDKIDQIIATKYWPDKFKNQDLIWYVKDYLKIIRLAIQLSE